MNPGIRKTIKTVWITSAIIFMGWNWSTFQSRNLPANTFTSTENVIVSENDDMISFISGKPKNKSQVIFFPGGLADPQAYAPLCRQIADNGFTCHIVKMSFRLPQYDYRKVSGLFDLKSKQFVIGGHSQGGKIAAQFVYENPGLMKGLFLMGTSHPRDIDLSDQDLPAIKFYAENDGLASIDDVLKNRNLLPHNTKLILIKGGNHSQFGYLGSLLGDDQADILLEKQQSIVLDNLLVFLNQF